MSSHPWGSRVCTLAHRALPPCWQGGGSSARPGSVLGALVSNPILNAAQIL